MLFILVLIAVVVVALAIWLLGPPVLGRTVKSGEQRVERMRDSSSALHFRVPDGQDPAVLTAALSEAGYEAVGDLVEGRNVIMIERRGGGEPDPDEARSVIERANTSTLEGGRMRERPVVFEEER